MRNTTAPLEIVVTGTGRIVRPAECAVLTLLLQSSDNPTVAEASAVTRSTMNKVRDLIAPLCAVETERRGFAAAISRYSMGNIEIKDNRVQQKISSLRTVFEGSLKCEITCVNIDILSSLASQITAMDNVRIQRIDWSLTEETKDFVRGEARRLAAFDAIRGAHDYAEVFAGVAREDLATRVRAVGLREDGSYKITTQPHAEMSVDDSKSETIRRPWGSKQYTLKTDKAEFEVTPEDVVLDINVEGKFTVECEDNMMKH